MPRVPGPAISRAYSPRFCDRLPLYQPANARDYPAFIITLMTHYHRVASVRGHAFKDIDSLPILGSSSPSLRHFAYFLMPPPDYNHQLLCAFISIS